MKSPLILTPLIFLLMLFTPITPALLAGEIELHDGSRYTGNILHSDDQIITMQIDRNGKKEIINILRIQVSKVSNLSPTENQVMKPSDLAPVNIDRPQNTPPTTPTSPTPPTTPTTPSTPTPTSPTTPTPPTTTPPAQTNSPANNSTNTNNTPPTSSSTQGIKVITELVNAPEYTALMNTIKTYRATLRENELNTHAREKLQESLIKRQLYRDKAYGHLSTGLRLLREARYKGAAENLYTASTWPEIRPLVKKESGMDMLLLVRACQALAQRNLDNSDGTGLIDEDKKNYFVGRKKAIEGSGRGTTQGRRHGNGTGSILSDESEGYGVMLAPKGALGVNEIFTQEQLIGLVKLYHATLLVQAGSLNVYNPDSLTTMKKSPFDISP